VLIAANTSNYVIGTVSSYASGSGSLTVTVTDYIGSGTYNSWSTNLAGASGGDGSSGTSGTSGAGGTGGTSGTSGTSGKNGTSGTTGTSGTSGTNGSSGTSGFGGTGGTSGTGFTYAYQKTLFVDPSGNNTTAQLGRMDLPWQTISGALSAINNNASYDGHTIHVFRGDYTETAQFTLSRNAKLYFAAGVTVTVTINSANASWITLASGVNLSIVGESNPYVSDVNILITNTSSDLRVFNMPNILSTLSIESINIRSQVVGASGATMIRVLGDDSGSNGNTVIVASSKLESLNVAPIITMLNSNPNTLFVKDSVLRNAGTSEILDYVISSNATNHSLILQDSIMVTGGGGSHIRIFQPTELVISDLVLWSQSTLGFTIVDQAISGSTNIDIGARCISTQKLPTSAGSSLINRTNGLFECELTFANPLT
jgi:hypothetical protein